MGAHHAFLNSVGSRVSVAQDDERGPECDVLVTPDDNRECLIVTCQS
jgi:hypothetical protein